MVNTKNHLKAIIITFLSPRQLLATERPPGITRSKTITRKECDTVEEKIITTCTALSVKEGESAEIVPCHLIMTELVDILFLFDCFLFNFQLLKMGTACDIGI